MSNLTTNIPELLLTAPIPERDAKFAFNWFSRESGRDTLLKMGNAPHEIQVSSLEDEVETLREFLRLEDQGIQRTWMMRYDNKTIGAAWIDLIKNHGVEAPSIHLMIGDPLYRGKGFGKASMLALIKYLKESDNSHIYSRYLVSNTIIGRLNSALGFMNDGKLYKDDNGLEWQNIILTLK